MSAEQELREALRYYDVTPADEEWSVILAAVGRLLDPIPDYLGFEEMLKEVRLTPAERRACKAYQTWLIGGESQ